MHVSCFTEGFGFYFPGLQTVIETSDLDLRLDIVLVMEETHRLQVVHAGRELPQTQQQVELCAQSGDVAHLQWGEDARAISCAYTDHRRISTSPHKPSSI